jgi:hypothetical protein
MTGLAPAESGVTIPKQAAPGVALPRGLANPFWLAYGAAATVGAGWWLMTRFAFAPVAPRPALTPPCPPASDSPPAPADLSPPELPLLDLPLPELSPVATPPVETPPVEPEALPLAAADAADERPEAAHAIVAPPTAANDAEAGEKVASDDQLPGS